MDWYKYHIADFMQATRSLNMTQEGAYQRLLNVYYQQGGPLPVDERVIFRLCNALHWREKAALRYVLGIYFVPIEGMYHNTRADEELLKYQRQCEANRHTTRNRIANESLPSRATDKIDRIERKSQPVDNFPQNGIKDPCQHINVNGQPCGQPGSIKLHPNSKKWFCTQHPDG